MSPMATQCYPTAIPGDPPEVEIPNWGSLRKAWGSLSSMPDAGDLIAQMQDGLGAALAPVRRYLELAELSQAFMNIMKSIPDCISDLSPDPFFEAVKAGTKAIARVIMMVPPLPYIPMGATLASYCIDTIDEVLGLLQGIDTIFGGYSTILSDAALAADQELTSAIACASTEMLPPIIQMADILRFIKPANDILLDPFIRLLPGGQALKPLKDKLTDVDDYLADVKTQLTGQGGAQSPALPSFPGFSGSPPVQPAFVPFPPLGALVFALGVQRDALVSIYNIIAPLAGLDPKAGLTSLPSFNTF